MSNLTPQSEKIDFTVLKINFTIKGGSRRAKKSRKVLMMMKAAKLGWAGPGARAGQEQARSRLGSKQEQGRSMSRVGVDHEQTRSRVGAG